MTNSIVLPRKKRRKPPGQQFWYTLVNLIWNIAFCAYDLTQYLLTNHLPFLLVFGGQVVCLYIFWVWFKAEYDRWINGE